MDSCVQELEPQRTAGPNIMFNDIDKQISSMPIIGLKIVYGMRYTFLVDTIALETNSYSNESINSRKEPKS